jgi:hypothetical protein
VETSEERRSDRIYINLPIKIAGTDALGSSFVDEARTVIVNRHGAKIVAARKLAPDQELNVHCPGTHADADARVLGQIGKDKEGYFYGIVFLDTKVNLWGIEFPAIEKGKDAVGRAVLECVGCHTREVAYLDEFEIEVLEANNSITRYCMRCTESTLWKKASGEAQEAAVAKPAVVSAGQEKRREPRCELRVQACIRCEEFAEEVVWTRNVSRGGLCFESRRDYRVNWKVEVSIPYSQGGGNIFRPGRIARVQRLSSGDLYLYGVAYARNPRVS